MPLTPEDQKRIERALQTKSPKGKSGMTKKGIPSIAPSPFEGNSLTNYPNKGIPNSLAGWKAFLMNGSKAIGSPLGLPKNPEAQAMTSSKPQRASKLATAEEVDSPNVSPPTRLGGKIARETQLASMADLEAEGLEKPAQRPQPKISNYKPPERRPEPPAPRIIPEPAGTRKRPPKEENPYSGSEVEPFKMPTPMEIYDIHGPRLYNIAKKWTNNPDDAMEAVQEVILHFLAGSQGLKQTRDRSGFEPANTPYEEWVSRDTDEKRFQAWLNRILINKITDRRRRKIRGDERQEELGNRAQAKEDQEVRQVDKAPENPAMVAEREEKRKIVNEILDSLDEKESTAVRLYEIDPIIDPETQRPSYEAVAGAMGTTVGNVKNYIHRAKVKLEAALRERFPEEYRRE